MTRHEDETNDESRQKPSICPRCGRPRVARILYGEIGPDADLLRRIRNGEIILGGCCVDPRKDPHWECNACGLTGRFAE